MAHELDRVMQAVQQAPAEARVAVLLTSLAARIVDLRNDPRSLRELASLLISEQSHFSEMLSVSPSSATDSSPTPLRRVDTTPPRMAPAPESTVAPPDPTHPAAPAHAVTPAPTVAGPTTPPTKETDGA